MPRYAAFLLGINVGGKRKVPMEELKKLLEKSGLKNVRTLLNSGNVLFDSSSTSASALAQNMHDVIEKHVGFDVGVIIRSVDDLEALRKTHPFTGIKVTPATRLYVTFISGEPKSTLQTPYVSDDKSYTILKVTPTEVISVLTVSEAKGTTDAMKILTKEFGKAITTRNWNTIEKMLA